MSVGLPLIRNVTPLVKSVLVKLGSAAAASALDEAIQKKIFGLGCPVDLAPQTSEQIISNEGMIDIFKIVKYLKEWSLLLNSVSETTKNETKE